MKIKSTPIGIPQASRPGGFTLVELLVSITIIIVLASLVFVVTGRIRASAQQTNAMSALRQIGIANVAYQTENNGSINVIRDAGEWGPHEGPGTAYASNSFMGRMQPYLFAGLGASGEKALAAEIKSSLNVLFNTTDPKTMAGTPFSGVPVTTDGSGISNPISVNSELRPEWGKLNPLLRVSNFGDPSDILYLTYGRYYFDELQGSKYTPLPLPGDRRRTIYYLPNRKAIFSFLDGHVEMLSPPLPERLFK
jgi:prepilin-type N-terminal cleavage/methylation domain-containing protein/prepilin-type processing-associated H-X9-DG protein